MKADKNDTNAKIDLILNHLSIGKEQPKLDPTAVLLKEIVARTVEWFESLSDDD